jgi:predicted RNase H-like nuclease (RuvC/YqgF family)
MCTHIHTHTQQLAALQEQYNAQIVALRDQLEAQAKQLDRVMQEMQQQAAAFAQERATTKSENDKALTASRREVAALQSKMDTVADNVAVLRTHLVRREGGCECVSEWMGE